MLTEKARHNADRHSCYSQHLIYLSGGSSFSSDMAFSSSRAETDTDLEVTSASRKKKKKTKDKDKEKEKVKKMFQTSPAPLFSKIDT